MIPPAPHRRPLGVVLAGGASRRFGRDKASELVGGQSLVERAGRLLSDVCSEVLLADRGRRLFPGLSSLQDGPGAGPAAGLLGAAQAHPDRWLLVLACDLPSVPASLLRVLRDSAVGPFEPCSWVPRHGAPDRPRTESLCALYQPSDLEVLAQRVGVGELALQGWLADPRSHVRFLEGEDLRRHGVPEEIFFNLNRSEDLERWLAKEAESSSADGHEDLSE